MAVASTAVSLKEPDWFVFLRAACAVAEGAAVLHVDASSKRRHTRSAAAAAGAAAASACVSAVLGDPHCRVAVLGGRVGLPRSLGSDFGGFVTRFLGGFRGVPKLAVATPGVRTTCGLAMTRDGTTLLVADSRGGSNALHVYSVHTGAFLHRIGGFGNGPLQFKTPTQVWVAPDGFVFVADYFNDRVQVLTPQLTFHSFVGEGQLNCPAGVCANNDTIVVSEFAGHCLTFFNRCDGSLLRRVGSYGRGSEEFVCPRGVCFMSGHRQVAVADCWNCRVSVWTLEGVFVRHIGTGKLCRVTSIACSDANELVVAEWVGKPRALKSRITLFDASGKLMRRLDGNFHSVAMHGGTMFAQAVDDDSCVVFS